MSGTVAPDHPVQKLLFFAQDISHSTKMQILEFIDGLKGVRNWIIRPPYAVNIAEPADRSGNDADTEAIGGVLEIYSALPPWKLPVEVDQLQLEDVVALITAIQRFSHDKHVELEFELDGTFVGSIAEGEPDRTLRDGLIGEWRKHLGI